MGEIDIFKYAIDNAGKGDEKKYRKAEALWTNYLSAEKAWRLKRGHKKKCGLCGSTKNLVGPFCGGPFSWYCENCDKIVRKWGYLRYD